LTNDTLSHTAFVHDTMASVSGTQFVTTYTDSDTDNDTDSDVDASDDELDVTTAKRARTTDTPPDSGSPRAAKRPRTDDDEPPRAHSPTSVIGADANAESESSDSESDSESDDSDDEEASDAGDGEKSYSEGQAPVAVVDTTTRCIKRYVSIVETRMRDRRVRQSWQQIVDEARRNIQYEIDNKPAVWKEGIGRASSYLAMMKALLNVSTVRSVNREMMLEVIGQAREVLEERWGGE